MILVTGGAGYIGSHMVKCLINGGREVVVLDNLSTGFRESVKKTNLVVGDLGDIALLETLFTQCRFEAVMHFAANSLVGESIDNPGKYYRNNFVNTLNLLDVMVRHDVNKFIFSSTAATYGNPNGVPIDERHPQIPINPYGSSKLMIEKVLQDYYAAYNLNSVSLRYFNAAGADPDAEIGESHDPETHLIPLILQVASGRKKSLTVYGRDYDTRDGTCVRDYVHVNDLCNAHALALDYLRSKLDAGSLAFNLGNGEGFSVQEVIEVVNEIVSMDNFSLRIKEGNRREGDPAVLVADAKKAKSVLGWQPQFKDLETIVRHAWEWEKKLAHRTSP